MTQTIPAIGPDWEDVVRRSRHQARRRLAANAVVLAVLAAVTVASAWALGHPVIDFGSAQPAGSRQVDDFGSLEVTAPPGMAPGVLPHQARRITTVRYDGKPHTLYVAPTKSGGYCYDWSEGGGSCRSRNDRIADTVYQGGQVGANGLEVLDTSFLQKNGERLVMTFADGSKLDIPFVWVTAPINAGFALYRVPDAHRQASTRAVSLALYDAKGKLIVRNPIQGGEPSVGPVAHIRGFGPLDLPQDGIWAKRTMLFDLRDSKGQRVGLWSMPKQGGGSCYVTNGGSGCTTPALLATEPPIMLGFNGDRICCVVRPTVRQVEATFQDGSHTWLIPKDGYLVWPIPQEHWPLGHRLTALIGYNAAGDELGRTKLLAPADQRGIYPCTKPKNLGYGVKECP